VCCVLSAVQDPPGQQQAAAGMLRRVPAAAAAATAAAACIGQVYERFGWRFNIISMACLLQRVADLTRTVTTTTSSSSGSSGSSSSSSQRRRHAEGGDRPRWSGFCGRCCGRRGQLLPSEDAATAAALLHSLSVLDCGGQGWVRQQARQAAADRMGSTHVPVLRLKAAW